MNLNNMIEEYNHLSSKSLLLDDAKYGMWFVDTHNNLRILTRVVLDFAVVECLVSLDGFATCGSSNNFKANANVDDGHG